LVAATASHLGVPLVTADRRLARAVGALFVSGHVDRAYEERGRGLGPRANEHSTLEMSDAGLTTWVDRYDGSVHDRRCVPVVLVGAASAEALRVSSPSRSAS